MNFKEPTSKVTTWGRKINVSAIVNANESGIKIENIHIGKVETQNVPNIGNLLIFYDWKINGHPINTACIVIKECDVQSISEIDGKIVVLVKTGAYYISLE